ncbi:extracellular solute-binding protein [Glycomyces buryatensis]|uniref:Extracellular solute-binding protein n=1 Tax=Glycomyces buryatensis TaxID=2570927 RepID=A0A4S8Q905_9ACTN|nr:extracellular solute-binding protein [Glycomyces buryatensis]THV40887.1 extracellular solute-binding protein [Glycomyces buryatensis]
MKRRGAAALAGLASTAMLLSACGGGGEDSNSLKILVVKHALTGPMEDMGWVEELEKAAGIPVEWEEVSADWAEKKSTMLAAGDIPDLVIGTNAINDSDMVTFTGLFEDLGDDMEALPNVAAMFEALPETEAMATRPDGEIYSIPSYRRFWPETSTRQYVNQQWLDNLGLEQPTTFDELHEVLLAFKNEDANGNGDTDDEIPIDWSPAGEGGFGFFQPSVLLGSFGLPITGGGGSGYIVEDGTVGNFLTDTRYRDLVSFLHELYADGLVSQDVMTQDYSAYQSVGRGDGDVAKVGFSWGWTASDRFGPELAEQYASTAPLLADASVNPDDLAWTYDSYGLNYGLNTITMSAQSSKKDAALKVIDAFYDQDLSIQALWGEFGENVEELGDGSYEVLPPADEATDPSTWKWTTTLADNSPGWIRDDIEVTLPTDLAESAEQGEPLTDVLANIDPATEIWPGELIKMNAEDSSRLSLLHTDLLGPAMQRWATWITEGGVESEWDAYTAELEGLGLTEAVEIHQRYYDDYQANLG